MWSAPKRVEIKDSVLAFVAKIGYMLVFFYIVLFEMLYRGSHLEVVPVLGVNQMHFRHPTENDCDDLDENCLSNFSWRNSTPYCGENTLHYAFKKKKCILWTSQEAEVQDGEGIALTTRARRFEATKVCNDSEDAAIYCPGNREWKYELQKDAYVMDSERYWIWMEHAMTSSRYGLNASSTALNGRWWSCDSEPCQYRDLLPMPDDWGITQGSAAKQPSLQSAAPSALANSSDSRTTASLLELKALAKRMKSSIVRSKVSARGSQSFMAKSRTRSRRFPRRYAASSANSVITLKTTDSMRGGSFVFSRPGTDSKKGVDVFPMRYLLDTANVDLDAAYKTETHRAFGLVLTLTVVYRNTQADAFDFVGLRFLPWTDPLRTKLPWDPKGHTRARYDVYASASDQGFMHIAKNNYSENRFTMWRLNGIYITVVQSGGMLVWSWPKLAVYVSTTLGLLSMAFHLTRFWASRQKPLQNLLVERYVARIGTGEYERVDSYDDPP